MKMLMALYIGMAIKNKTLKAMIRHAKGKHKNIQVKTFEGPIFC